MSLSAIWFPLTERGRELLLRATGRTPAGYDGANLVGGGSHACADSLVRWRLVERRSSYRVIATDKGRRLLVDGFRAAAHARLGGAR